MTTKLTAVERFWAKVVKTSTCWTWTGALSKDGYAIFWDGTRLTYAYRWLYEHRGGTFAPGEEWDHKCLNRACVRQTHGEPVTHAENMRRAFERKKELKNVA